jgi:cytochrome c-type biogenesis protein CcmE
MGGSARSLSSLLARGIFAPGRLKFVIGGGIILLVLGWLVFSNIEGASARYLTVDELLVQEPSDRIVRVSGIVVGETIDWDPQQLILRFEIADEGGSLPVVYEGVRPDMFRDSAQAVVEGKYSSSGVLEASTLLLKCPSKYVEE